MDFVKALALLRLGHMVRRSIWAPDMWLEYGRMSGDELTPAVIFMTMGRGILAGQILRWHVTQLDILADDWTTKRRKPKAAKKFHRPNG